MKAFVLATIHTDTPEFLDSLTYSQLAARVALAEKIIEVQQAIHAIEPTDVTLQIIDPEEEKQKQEKTAARHNSSKSDGAASYNDPIAQKLWGMK
jgi:homoaconitase/3-isopropylmalate dehydratase large subunit